MRCVCSAIAALPPSLFPLRSRSYSRSHSRSRSRSRSRPRSRSRSHSPRRRSEVNCVLSLHHMLLWCILSQEVVFQRPLKVSVQVPIPFPSTFSETEEQISICSHCRGEATSTTASTTVSGATHPCGRGEGEGREICLHSPSPFLPLLFFSLSLLSSLFPPPSLSSFLFLSLPPSSLPPLSLPPKSHKSCKHGIQAFR